MRANAHYPATCAARSNESLIYVSCLCFIFQIIMYLFGSNLNFSQIFVITISLNKFILKNRNYFLRDSNLLF